MASELSETLPPAAYPMGALVRIGDQEGFIVGAPIKPKNSTEFQYDVHIFGGKIEIYVPHEKITLIDATPFENEKIPNGVREWLKNGKETKTKEIKSVSVPQSQNRFLGMFRKSH